VDSREEGWRRPESVSLCHDAYGCLGTVGRASRVVTFTTSAPPSLHDFILSTTSVVNVISIVIVPTVPFTRLVDLSSRNESQFPLEPVFHIDRYPEVEGRKLGLTNALFQSFFLSRGGCRNFGLSFTFLSFL
jgi:hypothetical protein